MIWESVRTAVARALRKAEAKFDSVAIKAVGITNQREPP